MSEDFIVRHCSPTLAGMKTANMFTCRYDSIEEMREDIRDLNNRFQEKGIRVIPLRYSNGSALIYVYRPASLQENLMDEMAAEMLEECGYNADCQGKCLARLANRIRSEEKFPHEVGLFLGYPPEDVAGFIANEAGNYKCVGCWKVYGDEERATRTFAKYKKCTDIYCRLLSEGKTVEQLTVAK